MMWAIWYARRKAIHENIFQSPLSIHNFVNNYEYDLLASKPPQSPNQASKVATPPVGCMKVNIDAAVDGP